MATRLAIYGGMAAAAAILGPPAGDRVIARYDPVGGCRVDYVVDGDTIQMTCPLEGSFRARLVGFDAPEVYSPSCASEFAAGVAATQKLRSLLWGADRVGVELGGTDRYDRRLVRLSFDGRDVADIMVESGHARRYDGGGRAGWCA